MVRHQEVGLALPTDVAAPSSSHLNEQAMSIILRRSWDQTSVASRLAMMLIVIIFSSNGRYNRCE